jgi:hypothetical protein
MSRLFRIVRQLAEQDRGPILLLALLVALFFLPSFAIPGVLIWPRSGLGSDISYRHWPDLISYAANWRAGRWVLWDSSVALGRPLAGDPATLFLYPFSLLFMILPPAPAFNLIDALHVFLAGLFTFWLLRAGYAVSRPAALFAGLSFAFMPKLISHLAGGHVGVVWGLTWAPAVLLGLKLAFEGSMLAAALAGLALAVQMPNHIQQPYYVAVIGSAFWLWNLAPTLWQKNWKRARWLALVIGVWLMAFVLCAAAVLFPLIELLPYNSRADFSLADANLYALPPSLLVTLFVPSTFQFPEWTMYLGLTPILLGGVGWIQRSHRDVWFFGGLAVFALIHALGTNTPLFEFAFTLIPGFRLLRVPTRLWFFGGLAVAVLAGFGVEALVGGLHWREMLKRTRRWLGRIGGLYFVAAATGVIGLWALFGHWHWVLVTQMAAVMILSLFVSAWLNDRLKPQTFRWALCGVLLIDLLPVAADHIQLIQPESEFLHSTPALDFVATQPGLFRIYSPAGDLPYALAAEKNVQTLDGLLAFQIGHAVRAIREGTGCSDARYATAIPPCLYDDPSTAIPNAERLGQLNVRYVLSKYPLADPNFKLALAGGHSVYENLLWQPRARVGPSGAAEIVAQSAGEYLVRVSTTETAQLVVSETWLPGWQAVVDDRPHRVERAEEALLGVALSPGQHIVRLHYSPLGWRVGGWVSLASIGCLVLWSWAALRRNRY